MAAIYVLNFALEWAAIFLMVKHFTGFLHNTLDSIEMEAIVSLIIPEAARSSSEISSYRPTQVVIINVTKKRKTKHGDFRRHPSNGVSLITINTDSLNPVSLFNYLTCMNWHTMMLSISVWYLSDKASWCRMESAPFRKNVAYLF